VAAAGAAAPGGAADGGTGADVLAPDLQPVAIAIGEAWVSELLRSLRSEDREIIGPWPGTMSEARMRILASLRVKLATQQLDQLARIANLAARRGWEGVSQADPER
jgi:hypothetical protein